MICFLDKIKMHIVDINEGRVKLSDNAFDYWQTKRGEDEQIKFTKEKDAFRIRPSMLGIPICRQQFTKLGASKDEDDPFEMSFRFAAGNDFEGLFFAYAISAGVLKRENIGVPVKLNLGGQEITGTIDCIIEDKVYDIKTTRFISKWKERTDKTTGKLIDPFQNLLSDDPFAYVMQLMLYSYAADLAPGGWIVEEKGSHEIALLQVPEDYKDLQIKYLTEAENKVKILEDTKTIHDVLRQFKPEPVKKGSTFTGEYKINSDAGGCGYCPFKKTCFNAYKQSNAWYTRDVELVNKTIN